MPELKKIKEYGSKVILMGGVHLPETRTLVMGGSDFKVYQMDFAAEKPEPKQWEGEGHGSYVTAVVRTPHGIITGSYDKRLIWWDEKTGKQIKAVDAHDRWIREVIASPDGNTVASVADDMKCKIWDAKTGKLLNVLSDHQELTPNNYPSMLYAVTYSPDGKLIATGDKVGHVAIWDAQSYQKIGGVESPGMYTWDPKARRHSIGGIRSLCFSPDSKLLLVGGIGKIGNVDHLGGPARVEMFDWKENKSLKVLEDNGKKGLVEQIQFNDSGDWYLTAGGDHKGFITIYDIKSHKMIKQEAAPSHLHAFSWDKTNNVLYTVAHEKIVLWELKA